MHSVWGRRSKCGLYWAQGRQDSKLTLFLTELWHLIDVFTSVARIGHAEAEIKIKLFEHSVAKVVSLNHPEIFDRFISNSELHPALLQDS